MSVLFRGGCVVTADAAGTVWNPGDVRVDGDRITSVGPHDPAAARDGDEVGRDGHEVVDCRDRLVIPGLVNSHSHIEEILQRSLRDGLPLEPWFAYKAAIESALDLGPDAWYSVVALGAMEMLTRGVTTVLHHYFCRPRLDLDKTDAVVRAYEHAGMRVFLAPAITDLRVYDTMPLDVAALPPALQEEVRTAPLPPADAELATAEEIIRRLTQKGGRVRPMLGPSAPQRSSDRLLEWVMERSERYGCRIHTHALETRAQAVTSQARFGPSLFEHLESIGFLGPKTSFAHAIWLTRRDIEALGRTRTSVVHNPCSNLKLGDGVAPVPALLRAGANVALGTDGGDTSDSYSVLDQMKLAALIQRVQTPDIERWLSAEDAFRMGTLHGARLMGLESEIGSLEAGKRADVVLLRRTVGFWPLNHPVRQLVLGENGSSVDRVYVDGRVVVRDGRVTGLDEAAVLAAIDELAARLHAALPQAAAPADRWKPHLLAMHRRVADTFRLED
jgi:5-methylthioadenosine/S-adenosylhomocysteine deaminase